jgi:hypothetical protein
MKNVFSGMLRRVALFFISPILSRRMIQALGSFETSVLTLATRHNIPEDDILQLCVPSDSLLTCLDGQM